MLKLAKKKNRQSILFLVDGLDKLDNKASKEIFINKIDQIKQIKSNIVFTAQIDLLYDGNQIQQHYETIVLPMIKIYDKKNNKFGLGWKTLLEILYKRADASFFEEGVAEKIVEYSGGNPRHLLQLLKYTYTSSENKLTMDSFKFALRKFSIIFESFLTKDDYKLLRYQDENPDDTAPSDEKRKLLHNLALLQYNSYWWKSHPVVRTLNAYKNLIKK